MKQKTLTLIHLPETNRYRVERMTDTVEYVPGQELSKDEVHGLCRNAAWRVNINPRSTRTAA